MLKLPIGCACPIEGSRSRPAVPRKRRRLRPIVEETPREVDVQDVKVRVGGEGTPKVRLRGGGVPQTAMDHTRVEEQASVPRPELHGFADRLSCLSEPPV